MTRRTERPAWRAASTAALAAALTVGLLLSPAGSAVAEPAPLRPEGPPVLRIHEAPDGSFRVEVPTMWRLQWTPAPGTGEPATLRLSEPIAPWPRHVEVTIEHHAGAHRSAEGQLRRLLRSAGTQSLTLAPRSQTVGGRTATLLETAATRTPPLGLHGDSVPARVRELVVPGHASVFVLRLDAPVATEGSVSPTDAATTRDAGQAVFAVVADSFRPTDPRPPRPDDIEADEYAVYAAFFQPQDETPGADARRHPAPWELQTQFLGDARRTRVLRAATLRPDPLRGGVDPAPADGAAAQAWADWRIRNARPATITDRLDVPGMQVISESELGVARADRPLSRAPQQGFERFGTLASVSRVGFDSERRFAAFEVRWSARVMGASYRVRMRREGTVWVIDDVGQTGMWYQ